MPHDGGTKARKVRENREVTRRNGGWLSGYVQTPVLLLGWFGGFRRAVFESEAIVAGFEDVATVGKAIQQGCGHFGATEHCALPLISNGLSPALP
jgi:hypothetical protein